VKNLNVFIIVYLAPITRNNPFLSAGHALETADFSDSLALRAILSAALVSCDQSNGTVDVELHLPFEWDGHISRKDDSRGLSS
jgi:hypothetical protein